MPNYFVSYDLNGQHPTHAEMDKHLKTLGKCVLRVLETVWYVKYSGTQKALIDYAQALLSANDRVLVIEASSAAWQNLLVDNDRLLGCWSS